MKYGTSDTRGKGAKLAGATAGSPDGSVKSKSNPSIQRTKGRAGKAVPYFSGSYKTGSKTSKGKRPKMGG